VIDDGNDDGNDDGGGSVGSNNIYRGRAEPVLVSLSDLYSEEKISVCDVFFLFCLHVLLTTSTTALKNSI